MLMRKVGNLLEEVKQSIMEEAHKHSTKPSPRHKPSCCNLSHAGTGVKLGGWQNLPTLWLTQTCGRGFVTSLKPASCLLPLAQQHTHTPSPSDYTMKLIPLHSFFFIFQLPSPHAIPNNDYIYFLYFILTIFELLYLSTLHY